MPKRYYGNTSQFESFAEAKRQESSGTPVQHNQALVWHQNVLHCRPLCISGVAAGLQDSALPDATLHGWQRPQHGMRTVLRLRCWEPTKRFKKNPIIGPVETTST